MSNTVRALYVIVGLALLSLPAVRTSPDHGVAYDITGKKLADPGSMTHAIRLAVRFANARARLRALESEATTLHKRTPSYPRLGA